MSKRIEHEPTPEQWAANQKVTEAARAWRERFIKMGFEPRDSTIDDILFVAYVIGIVDPTPLTAGQILYLAEIWYARQFQAARAVNDAAKSGTVPKSKQPDAPSARRSLPLAKIDIVRRAFRDSNIVTIHGKEKWLERHDLRQEGGRKYTIMVEDLSPDMQDRLTRP